MRHLLTSACAGVVLVLSLATPGRAVVAQSVKHPASINHLSSSAVPESVTVAASTRYKAGAMHRWLVGSTYRTLWSTPIRVPVLNLATYNGGLTLTKAAGGNQTKSLRFETADGVEYVFRLSDKAVTTMPGVFKDTPVVGILQDQVSAMHPAAAVIAAPIIQASGILHPTAVDMVLPDDSMLGASREQFANRLGMLERYPNVPKDAPGFGGATSIIDSDSLLTLLNRDASEHVDASAFLTARLTDFLINDNDRHAGNWKWARVGSDPQATWEPIARDRDHAFTSYNGAVSRLSRVWSPLLVQFGKVPHVPSLTTPALIDARLLAGLDKPVWDSIVAALRVRITDSVIHAAALAMPIEYRATAPTLEAILRARRDALPDAATRFYRLLAARVQVQGTDGAEQVVVTRVSDGVVDVRLESAGQPNYARRFHARETNEILVYLHGGDDTAQINGSVAASIPVRIIGGNGTNHFVDSSIVAGAPHPTRLYDSGRTDGVSYGPDTMFNRRPYEKQNGVLVPHEADNGVGLKLKAKLSHRRGLGLTPRLGLVRYGYGFGVRPYATMLSVEGEYAVQYPGARVTLTADKRLETSPLHFLAVARMSALEFINFNGLGNATIDSGSRTKLTAVHQTQLMLRPAIGLAIGSRWDVSLGPVIQRTVTDAAKSPYVAASAPYGVGRFSQVGAQFNARYEWRTRPTNDEHTHHRVLVDLDGRFFPAALDVRSAFSVLAFTMGSSLTLPIPSQPLLVVRAGGAKLFGDFPFFQAATIGGGGTTRYMDPQRYAGDASVYATSELRIPLARFRLMMPIRMGVLGLGEAGRVYDNGRSPGGWHTRTGAGVWFGRGNASPVLTVTRTSEPGHTGLALRFGLNF